jgi:hypothetical protein
MAIQARVLVLTEAEQAAFYGPPNFTANDQRYFLALNDKSDLSLGNSVSEINAVCLWFC